MTETNDLITITQSGRIGDFKVEPDNVMSLPGVELYETGDLKTHETPTRIDEGNLIINKTDLEFKGVSTIVTFHLSDVTRVQPYGNAIDIYEKGKKGAYKFMWGDKISMKLTGIPGDDGKLKPLAGWIVAQYIINERNRVGNLLKAK
jgi:hypothetical protein